MRVFSFLALMLSTLFGGLLVASLSFVFVSLRLGPDLPDYQYLKNYALPTTSRLYSADGQLVAQYATHARIFVPFHDLPQVMINAIVAAEDEHFYQHRGVNPISLVRSQIMNVAYLAEKRRLLGASTITQQVTRNFFLTNKRTLARKAREMLLALRLERVLSKERILELYLNDIYLGRGAYGVASASLAYFGQSINALTVPQAAYLASLPKGPNNYDPDRHHQAAVDRRNWVLERMFKEGYIDKAARDKAVHTPLTTVPKIKRHTSPSSAYFAESVRRKVVERYGNKALLQGGLTVMTSLESSLQTLAHQALREGLEAYDRRHGYRGPLAHLDLTTDWATALSSFSSPPGIKPWKMAVVLAVHPGFYSLGLQDGQQGTLPSAGVSWALLKGQTPSSLLKVGDVILVAKSSPPKNAVFSLVQEPEIEGAIVALDPQTGRVLALSGGWNFSRSEFNRATQAKRQVGSAIKPFVYLAALEKGYTPATMILDAPFVLDLPDGTKWRPANASHRFLGPVPMRIGLEESRNLLTVRLAQAVGIDKVTETIDRFALAPHTSHNLSVVLGAQETTLLRLTTAYGMIANGGIKLTPTLIDRIQDRTGRTVFSRDPRPCPLCQGPWTGQPVPNLTDTRSHVSDPISLFQLVSMLQGVIQRGTGRRLRGIGRPLAGKTGTTNDAKDAWFIGFSPNLVVGVYAGFDQPRPLGHFDQNGFHESEQGATVALPIFKAFMQKALANTPPLPFKTPPGVRMVRIDEKTGLPPTPESENVILEAFRAGTEPHHTPVVIGTAPPRGLF